MRPRVQEAAPPRRRHEPPNVRRRQREQQLVPLEARAELLVEHRELAVEDQGSRLQARDRAGDAGVAVGVSTPRRLIRRTRGPSL